MTAHERPARRFRGHYLRRGRRSERGRIYLVTTVAHERAPIFSDWNCAVACARVLHGIPSEAGAAQLAWVVMPDHVHWLFSLEGNDLADAVRRFKSRAARAVNAARGGGGSVWQRGYHDHAVRRETDVKALARYVVANPIRAGLCERIGDYPFWDAVWVGDGAAAELEP